MPWKAAKPCCQPMCNELTHDSDGRCKDHKKKAWQKTNHGKSQKRMSSSKWEKLRQRVFRRDYWLCQVCLKAGKDTCAREVDHIIPISEGGTDSINNLQAICQNCHREKSKIEVRRLLKNAKQSRESGIDLYE